MKILIIGGGVFVGRALIHAALAAGHEVTAFSRGRSPLPCADRITTVPGDRENPADLAPLAAHPWDAVIDTCAYRPHHVELLHAALGPSTRHHTLISSISVYADPTTAGLNEDAPLAAPLDDPGEGITARNYGPLKAACDRAALAAYAAPLIIRPGIIAGPHDPTDRFTYWVDLIHRQARVVVPDDLPPAPIQLIDARDLAAWTIRLIEDNVSGPFNALGPTTPLTMGELLATIATALDRPHALEARPAAAFTRIGVDPDKSFPLRLPSTAADLRLFEVDGRRAWAAGLKLRPLADTARDTAAWFAQQQRVPKIGWPATAMAEADFPDAG